MSWRGLVHFSLMPQPDQVTGSPCAVAVPSRRPARPGHVTISTGVSVVTVTGSSVTWANRAEFVAWPPSASIPAPPASLCSWLKYWRMIEMPQHRPGPRLERGPRDRFAPRLGSHLDRNLGGSLAGAAQSVKALDLVGPDVGEQL